MSARAGRGSLLGWTALLAVALALPWLAGLVPGAVERLYADWLFPRIAALLAWGTRRFSSSVAEFLLLVAAGIAAVRLLRALDRRLRRTTLAATSRASESSWLDRLTGVVRFAALAAFAFHLLWGLNYARPDLRERLGWSEPTRDAAALADVVQRLAREANASYRDAITEAEIDSARFVGPDSIPTAVGSRCLLPRAVIAQELAQAHARITPSIAAIDFAPPRFPPLAGGWMTRAGIGGIYIPFTGEPHVNREPPDASLPFTMAHEMAHQRGVAPEDEANFIAWLACRGAGSPAIRYSAALHAYGSALRAYYRVAPDSAVALSQRLLDRGPRADRRAIRDFWDRHEGATSEVASRLNDAYLKTNAQTAGIESYGLMVDLLIACAQSGRWETISPPAPMGE